MDESFVVDASPLIALGGIGRLDLLTSLAQEVVVPETVATEVHGVADEASRQLAASSLRVQAVEPHESVVPWGLGAGESAVLSFAKRNPRFIAILDDLAARRCASAIDVSVRGTLGIEPIDPDATTSPERRKSRLHAVTVDRCIVSMYGDDLAAELPESG